jgi:hypothetical protein
MSVRNAFVLLLALSSILFLIACGGSGTQPANPVAPPTGGFGNSDLNGTYVFSVSGTDATDYAYAMAGTFTANGGGSGCSTKGQITSGTLDIADIDETEFSGPVARATISGSYCIGVDGRGQATVTTNIGQGFPSLTFDFVLQNNSHGLITEFDSFGTSSGTLDLQSAGVTPSGPYAFLFSGSTYGSSNTPFASAGNFTVSTGGGMAGTADFNDGAAATYTNEALAGKVLVSSSAPSTTFTTATYSGLVFDVFPIDATHLKFIEMDSTANQSGDAFSQTTTTMPTGNLAFTLEGEISSSIFAAGGYMVTDGAGDITSSSSEDFNQDGTLSPTTSPSFTGSYAATTGNAGRYILNGFSGFSGGTSYAAYPSSGGVLMLEVEDPPVGITTGAAYAQASGASFATSQGYGLNLSGVNLPASSEVDDIAEFTADSSGATVTGIIDENSTVDGPATYGSPLSGTYGLVGTSGRGEIAATAGTSTANTTLNGGFSLLFYTVDGVTFPFMEYDTTQISTGVFVEQNPPTSSSGVAKAHAMYVPHPLFHPRSAKQKKQ